MKPIVGPPLVHLSCSRTYHRRKLVKIELIGKILVFLLRLVPELYEGNHYSIVELKDEGCLWEEELGVQVVVPRADRCGGMNPELNEFLDSRNAQITTTTRLQVTTLSLRHGAYAE